MDTEDKLIPFKPADLTGRRVLVLAPHPDDETIGCGGSLAIHARAEDPIKVVFLTDGAAGDPSGKFPMDQYVSIRRQEAKEACACLGITDFEFWPYNDRSLTGSRGALRRLIDLLASFCPDIVYAPSPLEFHPDHRAACVLLCDALTSYLSDLDVAFYEIGQPIRVNCLVDITKVSEQKAKALSAYISQLEERPYGDISLALNRYRSLTLAREVMYAEGFSVWKSDTIRKIGPFSIPLQHMERLLPSPGEAGPLVSVVVRTKDRPALLANALTSIAAQSYANIEIVVVNDGGRDVQEVTACLAGDIPVTYITHEQSQGRAAAANAGMKAAKGLYLNFLDDDDVFYSDHVQTLVRAIQLKGEKVVYSGVSSAYYEGPPEDPGNCIRKETIFNQAFDPDLFLFANHIPIMSVLFHRDVFEAMEGFSTDLELFEDWEFLIRASRRFRFHHVEKVTSEYRFYGVADTEASHRSKYAYDQAQAAIFDLVVPYLTGEGWIKFLESDLPHALSHKRKAFENQPDPMTAQLHGKEEIVEASDFDYHHVTKELAQTSALLRQSSSTISELKARNEGLEALLVEIVGSRGWAWLSRFRKLKARLLPKGLGQTIDANDLPQSVSAIKGKMDGLAWLSERERCQGGWSYQKMKVAVVVHLYYIDLASDLVGYLKNIPVPFALFVSTRPGWEARLRRLLRRELRLQKLVVKGVANRGFDIQPFLTAFSSYYGQYDLICKVHGKKSSTRKELADWGSFLLKNLLGSPEIVADILQLFATEKDLGLLFPDYFPPIRRFVEWGYNWDTASRMGEKMGLTLERETGIDFPAGSMFWFRPQAMAPLFSLNLKEEDFEQGTENCEDGTLAHALERLFIKAIEHKGFCWKKVLYAPQGMQKASI